MREKRTPCSNTDLPVSLSTCKLAWSNLVPDWYVHIINSSSSGMRRDFDSSKSRNVSSAQLLPRALTKLQCEACTSLHERQLTLYSRDSSNLTRYSVPRILTISDEF